MKKSNKRKSYLLVAISLLGLAAFGSDSFSKGNKRELAPETELNGKECKSRVVLLGTKKIRVPSELSAATNNGKTVFSRGCFTPDVEKEHVVSMLTVYPLSIDIDDKGSGFTYQVVLEPVKANHISSYDALEKILKRKRVSLSSLKEVDGFKEYLTNYISTGKSFSDIDGSPIVMRCSNILGNANDCSFHFLYSNDLWVQVRGMDYKDNPLAPYANPDINFWNKVLTNVKSTVEEFIISDIK